jgi:hypothetical protein
MSPDKIWIKEWKPNAEKDYVSDKSIKPFRPYFGELEHRPFLSLQEQRDFTGTNADSAPPIITSVLRKCITTAAMLKKNPSSR